MKFAIAEVVATAFYAGYSPKAPGTAGALVGLLLVYLLEHFLYFTNLHIAAVALVLFLPSVWATNAMIDSTGLKDPQVVVVDEVLGQMLAFLPLWSFTALDFVVAFALFRLFDIWKPFPVGAFEKLPRGWGVIADDLMAGIYAALVCYIAQNFLHLPL